MQPQSSHIFAGAHAHGVLRCAYPWMAESQERALGVKGAQRAPHHWAVERQHDGKASWSGAGVCLETQQLYLSAVQYLGWLGMGFVRQGAP